MHHHSGFRLIEDFLKGIAIEHIGSDVPHILSERGSPQGWRVDVDCGDFVALCR